MVLMGKSNYSASNRTRDLLKKKFFCDSKAGLSITLDNQTLLFCGMFSLVILIVYIMSLESVDMLGCGNSLPILHQI
jgi:hypothetical protein